jgi:hypothetical protein
MKMALKDVLVPASKFRPANWLEITLAELSKEDADWLLDCLKDNSFSAAHIAKVMTDYGHPVSSTTINNIRKGKVSNLHG